MNEIIATVKRLREIQTRANIPAPSPANPARWQLVSDREWLLTYVRKLQAEIQRLEAASHG